MAEVADRITVVDHEFPAQMAGQRLGWTALTKRAENFTDIHIAAATIGEEGAKIEHHERTVDGETKTTVDYASGGATGFVDVAAYSMMVCTEESANEQNYKIVSGLLGENPGYALTRGGDSVANVKELQESMCWAPSAAHLMPTLRERMNFRGIEQYFPLAYYTCNLLIAHPTQRSMNQGRIFETDSSKLLMPDAAMAETTQQQVETVEGIIAAYDAHIELDEQMKINLTVFGEVPATEIPDYFIESRRGAHIAESRCAELSRTLLNYRGIYLPIDSHIGASRTWPYMDSSTADERKAFGQELESLNKKDTGPATRELVRELAELQMRREYAAEGLKVLQKLAELEARHAA